MSITVNGKACDPGEARTVAALLAARDLEPRRVVVELNHRIVPRDAFAQTPVQAGDSLEILQFVGGG